jgi:L-fuconolactonase
MQVDTHVHVVSEDEAEYPLQAGTVAGTGAWYREDPCSVERLIGLMDEGEVDAAVLVQAVSAYRYDNRYTAASAHRFPARCTSVACVDLVGGDPAGAARAVIEDDAMRGLRWFMVHEGTLAEPRAAWDVAGELGVPVVVTIRGEDRLVELAAAIPALPEIPLALDHCAFVEFSHGVPDALTALAPFPQLHLKVSTNTLDLMAAHGDPADAVAELAARFGAHRLMWGSDFSQTHDRSYPELAAFGRAAASKLGADDRWWFLGGTACAVWPELAP